GGEQVAKTIRRVFDDAAIDDMIRAPWIGEVKAVLSGYFGNAAQARSVARLIGALRQNNPELLYVCDPVMGDIGGLYVPEATA
ncbi:pyridoxal kinase, partial [Rhizobium ruizarguesonis]